MTSHCRIVMCLFLALLALSGTIAFALPTLENEVSFPAGTFVVPMDEKQAERILVFGFVHALLRSPNPIEIFRVIEPPNVTLSTDLAASPRPFAGGPFLILPSDASKVLAVMNRPEFKHVTVGTLTTQHVLDNIFRVRDPTKILVVKGLWGRTDVTLDSMKIPYNITTRENLAANPSMMSAYSLIVVDCPGWNGMIPSQVAGVLRSHIEAGNEVIFTDIALKDLDSTFPGYVNLWGPQPKDGVANAYGYSPARKYDPTKYGPTADPFVSEFPSQYYNPAPNPNDIKVFTESAGYVASSIPSGKVNDVRILADSKSYGSAGNQYAILAFYFEYGLGIVEGLAFHPQQQVKSTVGDNGYYAVYQFYGNKFVQRNYPKLVTSLVLSKSSYVVGETVSLMMNSNLPADYVLTIKKPDGTVWATANGVLPATFTKPATEPTGSYTAELSARYSGAYASASVSFQVVLGTYDVTISLTGLPNDATTTLKIDETRVAEMKGSDVRVVSYPVGTSHTFQVDEYVNGASGYRYHCTSNYWATGATDSNVFNYVAQVRLDTAVNPPGTALLLLTPPSSDGWYDTGTLVQASPTNFTSGSMFTFWELDGAPVGGVPCTIVMNSPHQLTAVFSLAQTLTRETTSLTTETTISTEVLHVTTTAVTTETIVTTFISDSAGAWRIDQTEVLAATAIAVVSIAAFAIFYLRRIRAVRPSARICTHCGFSNPPYTRAFCVKCGNPLGTLEA